MDTPTGRRPSKPPGCGSSSGRQPVVFIHGLWLLPSSPDVFAKKTLGQIADHTSEVIGKLDKKPAVMGIPPRPRWTRRTLTGGCS